MSRFDETAHIYKATWRAKVKFEDYAMRTVECVQCGRVLGSVAVSLLESTYKDRVWKCHEYPACKEKS